MTTTSYDAAARRVQAECLGIRVRQAARLLSRIYDHHMRPLGFGMAQYTVLVGVARFGEAGATLTKLADKLATDRTTLTRNLAPLERAGYLRVARSPHDARVKILLLTPEGQRTIEAGFPLWEQANAEVRKRLGVARVGRLSSELEAMRSQLDDPAQR
jgi:DNA-binding MarR family transcriptional regulator